ncbi:MAG: Omp28-related outer membrane protein [Aureispira sp.]|nr:Omp28-related outer membrane protein [Aureispira sp.]
MRSLFLLLFVLVSYGYADAQNFVSTTAENKNVVLEEFTGIYCGFCPAGHKIASDYKAANPNDVVVINIHNGSYANPSGGDPDFRTSFGAAIDGQANVQGYPAGTVNRRNFPGYEQTDAQGNPVSGITAMSRGSWVGRGNVVLAETSPVNVAAQATIDLQTRELEVIVETYFTAAAGTAPYKLNVALLQNGIEGPQSGSSGNPSSVLPNGNYLHGHMLRHFLTGQWGADITSTTSGYFQADTFRYTIPAGIANGSAPAIAAELTNMEVAVYVAEGQQTIITGNMASMSLLTPPGTFTASTKLTSASTVSSGYCDYSYIPSVVVENNSTSATAIDSFMVSYTLNGGTAVDQLVTTTLSSGATTTVTFPSTTLAGGANNIEYTINFDTYNNGTLIDVSPNADINIAEGPYFRLSPTSTATPVAEGFESAPLITGTGYSRTVTTGIFAAPTSVGNNMFSILNGPSYNYGAIGGFAASNRSIRFRFADLDGNEELDFILNKADLQSNSQLTFSRAHRQYSAAYSDQLDVQVSTNCGATWTTVWSKSGSDLATLGVSTTSYVPGAATDWVSDTVDLSAYNNTNDVVIRFHGISGWSNNLFIDDINLTSSTITGIENTKVAAAAVNIMPNPVRNEMTVEFNLPESSEVNMTIYNALGQQVQNVTNGTFEGTNTVQVNTSELASGVYLLNLASDKGLVTKRFTVKK